jgi:ABC-2 type transport system permease protein
VSWRVVARQDVRDAARSRAVWLLTALLALLFVGYAVAHGYLGESTFAAFVERLGSVVVSVVPIVAILLGYKSVAADRDDGSLFLTLSLPHSRRDVVIGNFVGRTVVLLVPTLVTLAVAGVVGAVRYGTAGALLFPWFLLVTACYGAAFVGVAVGLSVASLTDRRLTMAALGAYLFLVPFYRNLHTLVLLILHRGRAEVLTNLPDWALLFRLFQPSEAYYRLLRLGFDIEPASLYLGPEAPLYVGWWMALVILAVWALGPLALGYRRFRTGDL